MGADRQTCSKIVSMSDDIFFAIEIHFFFFKNTNHKSKKNKKMPPATDLDHLSAKSVQTIAEAFGFVISDDIAKAFSPDVEYRLRDIIQVRKKDRFFLSFFLLLRRKMYKQQSSIPSSLSPPPSRFGDEIAFYSCIYP